MNKTITYTLLILKAIAAAFFLFVIFAFILDAYQKREHAKIAKDEELKGAKEYIIGSWSKIKSSNVDDKRLNCLKKIRFDGHRSCEFTFVDHSEFGTYSLDLDSIYVETKPEGSAIKPKRYSYKLLLTHEPPYWEIDYLVIASSPNCSVKYKRVR